MCDDLSINIVSVNAAARALFALPDFPRVAILTPPAIPTNALPFNFGASIPITFAALGVTPPTASYAIIPSIRLNPAQMINPPNSQVTIQVDQGSEGPLGFNITIRGPPTTAPVPPIPAITALVFLIVANPSTAMSTV